MKTLLTYKEVHKKASRSEFQTPELSKIFGDLQHRLLSGEQISEFPKKVVDAVAETSTL